MRFWIFSGGTDLHITYLQQIALGQARSPLSFHIPKLNAQVERGDQIYVPWDKAFCGWGTVQKIEQLRVEDGWSIYVSAGHFTTNLLHTENDRELFQVLASRQGPFQWIASSTVQKINRLAWPSHSRPFDPVIQTFVYGSRVEIEEKRRAEVKGLNTPSLQTLRNSIKRQVDEYAVGFFNNEGGSIFWGISDNLQAQGIALDVLQKDEIKLLIDDKVRTIREYNGNQIITPLDYKIYFHELHNEDGSKIENNFIRVVATG